MTGQITGPAYRGALEFVNRVLRRLGGAPIASLPISRPGDSGDCAIARGIASGGIPLKARVAFSSAMDPTTGQTRSIYVVQGPGGVELERGFLPQICVEFVQQFDALGGLGYNMTDPAAACPTKDDVPRVAQSERAEAACGCALCLHESNPSADRMLEAVALHGRPGDRAAAIAKLPASALMPDGETLDVLALAKMPRAESRKILDVVDAADVVHVGV